MISGLNGILTVLLTGVLIIAAWVPQALEKGGNSRYHLHPIALRLLIFALFLSVLCTGLGIYDAHLKQLSVEDGFGKLHKAADDAAKVINENKSLAIELRSDDQELQRLSRDIEVRANSSCDAIDRANIKIARVIEQLGEGRIALANNTEIAKANQAAATHAVANTNDALSRLSALEKKFISTDQGKVKQDEITLELTALRDQLNIECNRVIEIIIYGMKDPVAMRKENMTGLFQSLRDEIVRLKIPGLKVPTDLDMAISLCKDANFEKNEQIIIHDFALAQGLIQANLMGINEYYAAAMIEINHLEDLRYNDLNATASRPEIDIDPYLTQFYDPQGSDSVQFRSAVDSLYKASLVEIEGGDVSSTTEPTNPVGEKVSAKQWIGGN